MRKMKVLVLSLCLFFTCLTKADAACSLDESSKLKALGVNVTVDYDVVQKKVEMDEGFNTPDGISEEELANYENIQDFFRIYISNITEELYVEVQDDDTKEKHKYTYQDAVNGVISFDQDVYDFITNYTITVYTSNKTGCPDTKLQTLHRTTPMYNNLSESAACSGIENFYLCHQYLSTKVNFDNYEELIEKYRQGKIGASGEEITDDGTNKNGFIEFIKENKGIAIAAVVLIVTIGGLVTVIIVRKQRSRVI